MEILNTIEQVRQWREANDSLPVAACYTMGALHLGHAQLMTYAREYIAQENKSECFVLASIFVNPTQFGNSQDLVNYPRPLAADLALLDSVGVNAVFIPTVDQMYPDSEFRHISVDPGPLGDTLEGESRPGHFTGVLTVVSKLLNITTPQFAFFGEKDYQQVALIARMVRELNVPVQIVAVPTVRDSDGVALSSRNAQLSSAGRHDASVIHEVLTSLRDDLADGTSIETALRNASSTFAKHPKVELDYLVVASNDLEAAPQSGSARALIAVLIEGVRLIDNISVEI